MSYKKLILSLWLICGMLISALIVGRKLSSPDFALNRNVIASVDTKIETVLELTAAATASSVIISAVPDDTATPIAEKLADFSSYFLIVLCVLYLEKYLVTLVGYVAFTFLIPLSFGILMINQYLRKNTWNQVAVRLGLFGLLISLMIPASVKISDMVYNTYQYSMQETVDEAEGFNIEVKSSNEETNADQDGLISKVMTKVTSITGAVLEKAKALIIHFMEALAIMIVTACLIPLLVIMVFWWALQNLMKVDTIVLKQLLIPHKRKELEES